MSRCGMAYKTALLASVLALSGLPAVAQIAPLSNPVVSGQITVGIAPNNTLAIAPGAASSNPVVFASSGSGGINISPNSGPLNILGSGETSIGYLLTGRAFNNAWSGSGLLTNLMPFYSTSGASGSSSAASVPLNYVVINSDTMNYTGRIRLMGCAFSTITVALARSGRAPD